MPVVRSGLPDDSRFDGTLTTTFLLALSTPVIVLPVERILKPGQGNVGLGDDRRLHKGLGEEVKRVLGDKAKFAAAPFFAEGQWSYLPDQKPFNVADNWPIEVLKGLAGEAAMEAAGAASAATMITHIRNALAHGNVTYLDKHGGLTEGEAAMYGFASAKTERQANGFAKIVGIHAWRIGEAGFVEFLERWAAWIAEAGIAERLNNERSLEAAL
jgi:hypothetical protein